MDITEQIAAAEAKVAASTERFVNSSTATPDERRAIDAQLREDIADLKALKAAARTASAGRNHPMEKQQAIQAAADAAAVWTQASHDYGPLSDEALAAGAHASIATDDAIRAGATPQDLKTTPNT